MGKVTTGRTGRFRRRFAAGLLAMAATALFLSASPALPHDEAHAETLANYAVYCEDGSLTFTYLSYTPTEGSYFVSASGGTRIVAAWPGAGGWATQAVQPWRTYKRTIASVEFRYTTKPTSTRSWFSDCEALTVIDCAKLDTSNATDISWMFNGCKKLESLDISGFDTSKATNMECMFNRCESLEELDVSSFDTSNVTDMSSTFSCCFKVKKLDVSKFDTSKTKDFSGMFQKCHNLESLDVTSFDMSAATSTAAMFEYCMCLKTLDLSHFNVRNATNIRYMFSGCKELAEIHVGPYCNWNATSNAVDSDGLFKDCEKLIGGNGTAYDANQITATYARDDRPGAPGYFTSKHAVTFKDWDGTVISTQNVEHGSPAQLPANPSRDGYTFTGWSGPFGHVVADADIIATYSIKSYTVTFKDHDGTTLKAEEVDHGYAASPPPDPSREGHVFAGWDRPFDRVTGKLTVTARYIADSSTVAFVDHDGTVIEIQDVEHGSGAAAPADPVREGYTFEGWNREFSDITGPTVVMATYKPEKRTVRFEAEDGTLLSSAEYDYGTPADAIIAPAPPVKLRTPQYDYAFASWGGGLGTVTADVTYRAVYTAIPRDFMVMFLDDDGTVIDAQLVEYGGAATAPADPVREGRSFTGWDAEFGEVTEQTSVRATYKPNTFTVTFADEDGTALSSASYEWGTRAADIARPAPAKDSDERFDYSFAGWSPEVGDVAGDATYTAAYTPSERAYSVRFVSDGKLLASGRYAYGELPEAPADPVKRYYAFAGWDAEVAPVAADAVYDAVWKLGKLSAWTDEASFIYTGAPCKPRIKAEVGGWAVDGSMMETAYADNVRAGKANAHVKVTVDGAVLEADVPFSIAAAGNASLAAAPRKVTLEYAEPSGSPIASVSGGIGPVTFAKTAGDARFAVGRDGTLSVAGKPAPGSYVISYAASDTGDVNHARSTVTGMTAVEVVKAANPLAVKTSVAKVKSAGARTGAAKKLKLAKLLKVSGAQGKVTFKRVKAGSSKALRLKGGRVVVKKGAKRGTYKMVVEVSAAGNDLYRPAKTRKTVVVKVGGAKKARGASVGAAASSGGRLTAASVR